MQVSLRPLRQSLILFSLAAVLLAGLSGCAMQPKLSRAELVQRAEAHLQSGDFHKALMELNQALTQDPQNLQVHTDLAWVYVYTGQLEKALAEIKLVEKANPNQPGLHYVKGTVYKSLGQWVDELEAYNEALKTDVNNPRLHHDIAHAFLEVNEPQAALNEYNVARKLDSGNSDYEFGRCMAYRQLKEYDKALKACHHAVGLADLPESKEHINSVIHSIELLQILENKGDKASPQEDAPARELPAEDAGSGTD